MSDAPSPGELSRRIDHVMAMQAQLVTRAEYGADQRFVDRRFVEVEADISAIRGEIAELRRQMAADMKELKTAIDAVVTRQDTAADKRGSNFRQALYNGIFPAMLLLAGFAFQLWLARGQ